MVTKAVTAGGVLWYATAVLPPPSTQLEGSVSADVCIVGAGITGLSTALALARTGVRVVVLEAHQIGHGASGRNLGHSTPAFSHYGLPRLRKLLGEPWAERLIARQTRANDVVAGFVRDYDIQCEWVQNGYVMAAARPDSLSAIERKAQLYGDVGARTRVLSRAEAEELTGSPRYFGGWFHMEAGHLNPLGYSRGLARAVIVEGGAIHTASLVERIDPNPGGGWAARTTRGTVVADKIIFATGAYTAGGWPGLDRSYKAQPGFVAATQTLPEDIRSSVLPRNTSVTDGRGDLFGYKYDGFGRIVASMIPMGSRGRDVEYTKKLLTDRLKWYHPQLTSDLTWEYFWSGEIDMQPTTVPRLYALAPGIVAVTGLSGRGVPTGSMLGGVLAEWANGVRDEDLALKLEPLAAAPFYMAFAPQMALRYFRGRDWLHSKLNGIPLPPHP